MEASYILQRSPEKKLNPSNTYISFRRSVHLAKYVREQPINPVASVRIQKAVQFDHRTGLLEWVWEVWVMKAETVSKGLMMNQKKKERNMAGMRVSIHGKGTPQKGIKEGGQFLAHPISMVSVLADINIAMDQPR